jgi:GNAT superfamily N-acetyltransferase
MEIRPIREADIPVLLDLVAGTMTASTPEYIEEYRADLDRHMRYYLMHEDRSAQYVAVDGDSAVGFALAGVMPEEDLPKYYFIDHADPRAPLSWILLEQITVDAAHRGANIGSLLLDRIARRAKELGLKGVYTGTRGKTRIFYEKNGFVVDKVYLKRPV